jgi:hypothetical protein
MQRQVRQESGVEKIHNEIGEDDGDFDIVVVGKLVLPK